MQDYKGTTKVVHWSSFGGIKAKKKKKETQPKTQ